MSRDLHQYWHLYDQGVFNYLKKASNQDAEKFVSMLNHELGVDLFSDGFRGVLHPMAFLEAIGVTAFNVNKKKIEENVLGMVFPQMENGDISIKKIPEAVRYYSFQEFFQNKNLIPELLLSKCRDALKFLSNSVVVELVEHTITAWSDEFGSYDAIDFHQRVCFLLATEYMLQFPYREFLTKKYEKNSKERDRKTNELYHVFLLMAADSINSGENISYFRAFDLYRKFCFEWRKQVDHDYKKCNATLENDKDLLDSYVVHFALVGYFFANKNYKVAVFTTDTPDVMQQRLGYARKIFEVINHCSKSPFRLNPGIIYCFDEESLELRGKIMVSGFQKRRMKKAKKLYHKKGQKFL